MPILRSVPRGKTGWITLGLVAFLALLCAPAQAQCTMGSGGGHQHGDEAKSAKAPNDAEARRAILNLLGARETRSLVLQEVLADDDFVDRVVTAISESPRMRQAALRRLGVALADTAPPSSGAEKPPTTERKQTLVYTCPMHLQVRSEFPGTCPKCGMTLQRVETETRKHEPKS